MSQAVHLRKYGVEATVDFELYEIDGVDLKVDAASATGDINLVRDGAAEEELDADAFVDEGRSYSLVLSTAEATAARIIVYIVDQGTKTWLDKVIVIETYGHASAQHAMDFDATVQTGAQAAIEANNLDHLMKIATSDRDTLPEVGDDTVLANILTKTDGDTSDFDHSTDSLEAIRDSQVSAGTGASACVLTIRTTGSTAIEGALVWITLTDGTFHRGTLTTSGTGQVTFNLADGSYKVQVSGAGHSYDVPQDLTVSGATNQTYDIGTEAQAAPGVGGAGGNVDDFLTQMVNRIRLLTDEPTTEKKYSDTQLFEMVEEAYASILNDTQRNSSTQIVCKYTITYSSTQSAYILPATAGKIVAIGEEDSTYETKFFYTKGSWLSNYGTRMTIQGNYLKIQPEYITNGRTITIWYEPDGCAKLFAGTASATTTTTVTYSTLSVGVLDARANAYVGSILRILPSGSDAVQQESIISSHTSGASPIFTVNPPFASDPSDTAVFDIVPPFPASFHNVVATKVSMRIVGIEGNTDRYKMLVMDYKDQMRSLLLAETNKDFMEGSIRRTDGHQSHRGSYPVQRYNRRW